MGLQTLPSPLATLCLLPCLLPLVSSQYKESQSNRFLQDRYGQPIARPGAASRLILSSCRPPSLGLMPVRSEGRLSVPALLLHSCYFYHQCTLCPTTNTNCHLAAGFLVRSPFLSQELQVNCYLRYLYLFTFTAFSIEVMLAAFSLLRNLNKVIWLLYGGRYSAKHHTAA